MKYIGYSRITCRDIVAHISDGMYHRFQSVGVVGTAIIAISSVATPGGQKSTILGVLWSSFRNRINVVVVLAMTSLV